MPDVDIEVRLHCKHCGHRNSWTWIGMWDETPTNYLVCRRCEQRTVTEDDLLGYLNLWRASGWFCSCGAFRVVGSGNYCVVCGDGPPVIDPPSAEEPGILDERMLGVLLGPLGLGMAEWDKLWACAQAQGVHTSELVRRWVIEGLARQTDLAENQ